MDIIALLNEYIKSELLVLTPVLYVLAKMLENSHLDNERIPWIVLAAAVFLAGLYTFAKTDISTLAGFLMALFSTIVQGVLLSGTAIFGGILGKLIVKNKK